MKVALIGPYDVRAAEVGRVIDQFTDADELVTTGALRGLVDILVKRRPRARRPRVSVQHVESGRYEQAEARRRLAMRIVADQPPVHAIVIVGELDGEFVDALLDQAGRALHPIAVWSGEEFIKERVGA